MAPTAPGHVADPAVTEEIGSESQTLHSGPDKLKALVVDEGLDRSAGKSVATGDERQTSSGGSTYTFCYLEKSFSIPQTKSHNVGFYDNKAAYATPMCSYNLCQHDTPHIKQS